MKKFKISTKSGTYEITMRAQYDEIKNEQDLRNLIQRIIDDRAQMPNWETYAQALQNKLDNNDLMDIAGLLGFFTQSRKVSDKATDRLNELTEQGMSPNRAARKVQRELGSQW